MAEKKKSSFNQWMADEGLALYRRHQASQAQQVWICRGCGRSFEGLEEKRKIKICEPCQMRRLKLRCLAVTTAYAQGMTVREITAAMRISVAIVRHLLERGRHLVFTVSVYGEWPKLSNKEQRSEIARKAGKAGGRGRKKEL